MRDDRARRTVSAVATASASLDYGGVPALVAGYDPKWRHVPVTRVLPPPSPSGKPATKWGRPSLIHAGLEYETGELCDGRPSRPITVRAIGYEISRGRWECVVVSSPREGKRRAGDRVYRLAKDLRPKTPIQKGTP